MENKSLERDANSLTDVISSLISEIEGLEIERNAFGQKAIEWEEKANDYLNDYGDAVDRIGELQQQLDDANEEIKSLTYQLNSK